MNCEALYEKNCENEDVSEKGETTDESMRSMKGQEVSIHNVIDILETSHSISLKSSKSYFRRKEIVEMDSLLRKILL